MSLQGKRLGRYSILHQIGSGGMGDVYAASDPELGRVVALKVLRSDLAETPELLRRFEREARAIAALEHPNIVTIHSVEEVDGTRFLTMELVEGETLEHRLRRKRLTLREMFEIGIPMADAVGAAHERGITHRDLKPANVMISGEGRIKILDFGLAKQVPEAAAGSSTRIPDPAVTSTGAVVGTIAYMSPEQAEGQPVDHRSDIFSLGVILYEMATGARPFQGESRISILAAIVNDEPRPVSELNAGLPHALARIVQLALEKDRERRFQSAKDLRNELEHLRRELSSSGTRRIAAASPRGRGRRWTPFAIGALAGLAVGITAILGFRGEERSRTEIGVIRRVTGDPMLEVHPAISPSGHMIVYSAGPPGGKRLYSRTVTGSRPVALTEELDGNHQWPAWSPDESQVVFQHDGACWVVSPLGGGLRRLEGVEADHGVAFSPDGTRIAYAHGSRLTSRRLDTGESVDLVSQLSPNSPSWSPDSSRIAFTSGNPQFEFSTFQLGNAAESSIWIVPATGGEPVLVIEGRLNVDPVWRGDRELLFVSNREGPRDVYSIMVAEDGRPEGPPCRLTTGLDVHSFSLTADGTRMAYSEFSIRSNVWSLPVPEGDAPVSSRTAEPVTRGNQLIEGIGVSRDGEFLVFDSDLAGNQDVYRLKISTGELKQLTIHPRDDFLPEFSPDGREVAFYSFRTGNRDLHVMAADGTGIRQITDDPAQDRYPYWSPDGNRLVFYSDRTGQEELWVTARAERGGPWSEPEQLTFAGGMYGRWSPDGERICFTTPSQLWLVPAAGGEPRGLLPESSKLGGQAFPNWSPDGRKIYFKAPDVHGRSGIWSIPVDGGEPTQLVVFDDVSVRTEFATDGRRFFFTLTEQQSDIFTLELR